MPGRYTSTTKTEWVGMDGDRSSILLPMHQLASSHRGQVTQHALGTLNTFQLEDIWHEGVVGMGDGDVTDHGAAAFDTALFLASRPGLYKYFPLSSWRASGAP